MRGKESYERVAERSGEWKRADEPPGVSAKLLSWACPSFLEEMCLKKKQGGLVDDPVADAWAEELETLGKRNRLLPRRGG